VYVEPKSSAELLHNRVERFDIRRSLGSGQRPDRERSLKCQEELAIQAYDE
jgi:hypothetical protein